MSDRDPKAAESEQALVRCVLWTLELHHYDRLGQLESGAAERVRERLDYWWHRCTAKGYAAVRALAEALDERDDAGTPAAD